MLHGKVVAWKVCNPPPKAVTSVGLQWCHGLWVLLWHTFHKHSEDIVNNTTGLLLLSMMVK